MIDYIINRLIYSIPLLLIVSLVAFIVINLPEGDYMNTIREQLQTRGGLTREEAIKIANQMRERYGLNEAYWKQYVKWIGGMFKGDLGYSFRYQRPVSEIIWQRIGWTLVIAFSALVFSMGFGVVIGLFSATHQYSLGDNIFTIFAFLGLSIPNFFLALIFMYLLVFKVGVSHVGGLFSPQYVMAPWDLTKVVDFLKHFWVPVVVVGTAGTAGITRMTRNNLLDILGAHYIQTARAKGLKESVVTWKHALRNAVQPLIMNLGMRMPRLITGSVVVSIVLNLPTAGPMLLEAVTSQDMYLAGSFLLLIGSVLVIGNLLADIALAMVDPRIRYD